MHAPVAFPRWPFALASVAFVGLIFWLSSRTGDELGPRLPGPSANLLHVPVNTVLAALLLRALVPWRSRFGAESWPGISSWAGAWVLALVLVHGVLDEIHQFHVPTRTCSVLDVVMDVAGGALVLLWPRPRNAGRPASFGPFAIVLVIGVGAGVLGWTGRPFPDRLLEDLLS